MGECIVDSHMTEAMLDQLRAPDSLKRANRCRYQFNRNVWLDVYKGPSSKNFKGPSQSNVGAMRAPLGATSTNMASEPIPLSIQPCRLWGHSLADE
jgi:hypothetical protein